MNRENNDKSFERVMDFYNNTKSHEAGCHNIYLLQTVNMDGDIVDEKFAVNLITNVGMDKSFCSEGLNQFRDLYIGSGSGTPSVADTDLFNLITTSRAVVSDSTHYKLPLTYDSANGIIIGTRNILACYFDYNISGITESVNITEIGYKNYSSLFTHALVCDRSGNVTYITKNINEKLNIKIYVAANVKESLITDAYANGIYISGDPQAFLRTDRHTTASSLSNYVTANYFMGYAKSPSSANFTHKDPQYIMYENNGNDKIYQFDIKSEDIVLEDKHDCIAMTGVNNSTNFGTYDAKRYFRAYGELIVFTEDKMTNPEECSCECIVTNSYLSGSISSSFGTKEYDVWSGIGNLPCTDFIISSVNMYNHLTQSWDIAEAFDQTADAYMGNSMLIHSNIGIVLNGKNTFDCRVYTNTRTDIPITSFNNNQVVMYASDKFWDVSTYELISDPNAVPASLQKKRYYITTKDLTAQTTTSLYPTRDYAKHKIVSDPIITLDITPNSMFNSRQIPISSDINGWFLIGDTLVYPFLTGTPSYILTPILRTSTSYNSSIMVFSNDNKILMFGDCDSNYNNYTEALKLRIYNVSNGTVAPTYNDITMDFGSGVTNFNNATLYRSFTTNGFAVCWHSTSNTSVIIDIRNDTPTQKILANTKFASAMAYTNYCVYKNMDLSKNTFEIYDMTTDTIVDTFDLPDDVAYVVNGVNCWKNNIYIHVTAAGASSVFIYQMDEGMLTYIDTNVIGINYFTNNSSNINRMVSCFDECVIFGFIQTNTNYETYMFMQGDPTKPIHIGYSGVRCQVKSCKYGKILPLLIDQKGITTNSGTSTSVESSLRYMVLDLGKMIDSNKGYTMNTFPYKHYPITGYNNTYDCNYAALFGDYVVYLENKTSKIRLIPIELWMMHKVTGTTRTIQSYNNPKKILGKTFNIRISNTGRWTDVKPSG